ncbi:MAG TPA: protein BatD, partial [Gammaproteobacteria bacterium]|nr:protein BatD [Gammaproteobacteria bacterium]
MVSNKQMNNIRCTSNRQYLIYGLFVISTLFSSIAAAANITVSTSRNPISLDDSFHLIYEANSSVDEDPDFTPVYKNFDVLSSSQSTNMRSVNGSWDLKKTWDLTVIAKDIGQFTVPPISFGKDVSPAIRITIINSSSPNSVSPSGQASIPAKIFLETSIDKKTGWVQSQFVYTVRLLRTVSIAGASLTELTTTDPDAITQMISEDNYQTTRNGIRYEVFERRYAIFPQKSGELRINPVVFEGRVNSTQARSIFDQFRMSGQMKRLRSKAINITIKPAPATINLQDWLPASDLRLIEEWSDDTQDLKAGEPVTRTIMIAAEGLTGVQLPDLPFDDIEGMKQYPDKAVIEDKPDTTGITGYKQIKVALIPAKAGTYILPEVKLQWWNTRTNKKEIARLPATSIKVTGSATSDTPPAPMKSDEIPTPVKQPATTDKTLANQTLIDDSKPYWKWLALFFALAWLLTLILYFRKPLSRQKPQKIRPPVSTQSIRALASDVEKNARKNDATNTRNALIEWARLAYGDSDITNLSQINKYCSPRLEPFIRQLNEALYSTEEKNWDGKALLRVFSEEKPLSEKQKNESS